MADQEHPVAEDSAEKAYAAAAAEAAPVKAEPAPAAASAPVEFPAKVKRAAPAAKARAVKAPEPVVVKASEPVKPPLPKAGKLAKPAAKAPVPIKRVALRKPAAAAAKPKSAPIPQFSTAPQRKDKIMPTAPEITEGFQKAAAETQAKAKLAFAKGSALLGGAAQFTKGNVDAIVSSGKILATGVQSFGSELVAEGKTAIETATGDVKQLAAVKSPSEFFKLQGDILRRNFDSAVSLGTKNSETVLKIASESFAPISGRVSLAVEKLKKVA